MVNNKLEPVKTLKSIIFSFELFVRIATVHYKTNDAEDLIARKI